MQVGVDVTCMYTNFGGCGPSGFGDKISLWSIVVENLIDQNRFEKFMQLGIDVTYMHTSFGRRGFFWFQRYGYLSKTAKFPFRTMDYGL